MNRRPRTHLPGRVIHIATRTQWRERLFDDALRTRIVATLRLHSRRWDAAILAYAVMSNHLHLVLRQGSLPLGMMLQPLLRRIAHVVQRATGQSGHVFERRFRDLACTDECHVRNAIAYTHLNPVRAGMVTDPGAYAWSSHGAYVGRGVAADGGCHPVHATLGLAFFALPTSRRFRSVRRDYAAFLRWRLAEDERRAACRAPGDAAGGVPPDETDDETSQAVVPPEILRLDPTEFADPPWLAAATSATLPTAAKGAVLDLGEPPQWDAAEPPSLATIATSVLATRMPGACAELLRSRNGGRSYAALRRDVIRCAAANGYSHVEIARYLRVSAAAISRVLTRSA